MKKVLLFLSFFIENQTIAAENTESLKKNMTLPETTVDRKAGIVTIKTNIPVSNSLDKNTLDNAESKTITPTTTKSKDTDKGDADANVCQEQGNITINYNIITND